MRHFKRVKLSAIFKPRKYQCDVCYSNIMVQINQDIYKKHIATKKSAQEEQWSDKINAGENSIYCFTMDASTC